MQLPERDQVAQAHRPAERDREHRERHEGREEASHEVERAEQVAHPFVRERHHQVEREQAVTEGERDDEDCGVAADAVAVLQAVGRAPLGELADVGLQVVVHEAPGEPREQCQDQAVTDEEELRGEPGTDVGAGLVQPGEHVLPPEEQSEEQHQRHDQERRRRLGEADHDARPVTLRELLGRGEHHARLRQPDPEHEVDVIGLPRTVCPSAPERPQEDGPPDESGDRAQGYDAPDREGPRPLNQLRAGRSRSGAHRLPALRACACSVRT